MRLAQVRLRTSVRQFVCVLLTTLCTYLLIARALMPAQSRTNKPRDILSVEQRAAVVQQRSEQELLHPGNEEKVMELVQNIAEKGALERIRSPEPNMVRNESAIAVHAAVGERPLAVELSNLEMESQHLTGPNTGSGGFCPQSVGNKYLIGHIPQATLLITNLKEAEVLRHYPYLKPGGHWKPTECTAKHKVAVIIPFRDRQTHLTRLLDFLIPILKRQLLDFRFIVTEQYGQTLFNKGRIMNAAFRVAEPMGVDCVIFHDVDMFPQDDRNFYGCPPSPRHIGAFVSNLGYQLWYKEIVGGVLAISMDDFRAVNGYSNQYWAWGGEDDDMGKRILSLNMTIERPDPSVGRFTMLKHLKRKRIAPKLVYKLLASADTRWETDGLNVTSWRIVKMSVRPLYSHLYVNVGTPPPEWS